VLAGPFGVTGLLLAWPDYYPQGARQPAMIGLDLRNADAPSGVDANGYVGRPPIGRLARHCHGEDLPADLLKPRLPAVCACTCRSDGDLSQLSRQASTAQLSGGTGPIRLMKKTKTQNRPAFCVLGAGARSLANSDRIVWI